MTHSEAQRAIYIDSNQSLNALLVRHDAANWAFVTAWNPASIEVSRLKNDARHRALVADAQEAGYQILRGEGTGESPAWQPEESILILDIQQKAARRLGRKYGQLAIVVGRRGARARLLSCAVTPPGATRGQSTS